MGRKLYVGNLLQTVASTDLRELFTQHGNVLSAKVVADGETGRSKCFGFVEMETEEQAQAAIQAFHEHDHEGQRLTVEEAKPRVARTSAIRGQSGDGRRY